MLKNAYRFNNESTNNSSFLYSLVLIFRCKSFYSRIYIKYKGSITNRYERPRTRRSRQIYLSISVASETTYLNSKVFWSLVLKHAYSLCNWNPVLNCFYLRGSNSPWHYNVINPHYFIWNFFILLPLFLSSHSFRSWGIVIILMHVSCAMCISYWTSSSFFVSILLFYVL